MPGCRLVGVAHRFQACTWTYLNDCRQHVTLLAQRQHGHSSAKTLGRTRRFDCDCLRFNCKETGDLSWTDISRRRNAALSVMDWKKRMLPKPSQTFAKFLHPVGRCPLQFSSSMLSKVHERILQFSWEQAPDCHRKYRACSGAQTSHRFLSFSSNSPTQNKSDED